LRPVRFRGFIVLQLPVQLRTRGVQTPRHRGDVESLEEGQAKDTLEDIGFRWPREGGPGGGGPGGGFGPPGGGGRNEEPVSPFEDKKNAASLKALKERLEKQGSK